MSKTSHPVPRTGDIVRLNKEGLETLFGSSLGLSHMMTKELKVVAVSKSSLTHPELSYEVEVDDPEIAQLMITNWGFDIVRRA